MKKNIFWIFIFLLTQTGFSQQENLHKVQIAQDGFNCSFYLDYSTKNDLQIEDDRTYHWFSGGEIHQNQGGYAGQLLQSVFEKHSLDGKLLERGMFKNGLKVGKWKSWDRSGKLIELVNWEDGLKDGKYWSQDVLLNQVTTAEYKDDLLNGKYIVSSGDSIIEKKKYRNGELKAKKSKDKKTKAESITVDNEHQKAAAKKED